MAAFGIPIVPPDEPGRDVWDVPLFDTPAPAAQEIPDPPEHTFRPDPEIDTTFPDVDPVEYTSSALVAAGEDLLLASPERAREVAAAVKAGLLARLRQEAAQAAERRVQAGPRPSVSDLLAEAQTMVRAHEVLTTLGRTFTEGGREPAALLADAMHDHLGPSRKSMKVGTPDGGELALTVAAAGSKVSVDEAAVEDVLVARAGHVADTDYVDDSDGGMAYLRGVRDGIDALRCLLGASPGWKSTALDALVRDLEKEDEGALAARLSGAYARVESGDPTPRLSVTYGD